MATIRNAIRDYEISKLRNEGWTLQKIGDQFDLNRERVRQICNREKSKLKRRELIITNKVTRLENGEDVYKKEQTINYIIKVMQTIQDSLGVM